MDVLAVGSAGFQRSGYAVMLREVLYTIRGRLIVVRNYTEGRAIQPWFWT